MTCACCAAETLLVHSIGSCAPNRAELCAARASLLMRALSWGGWGWVVVPGRLLAAAVEAWVVGRHLRAMLQQDAAALEAKRR